MRGSNPMFRDSVLRDQVTLNPVSGMPGAMTGEEVMTVGGTIQKTALLLALLLPTAAIGIIFPNNALLIASIILGIGLSLATGFKPEWARFTAPGYSLVSGYFVGVLSLITDQMVRQSGYPLGVPVAILGTIVTLGIMLGLYSARIIRVTETFRAVVIGATLAVFATYLVTFGLSFFMPNIFQLPIYGNGWIGIGFSIVVIGLAAFNLCLDFAFIEDGVNQRLKKDMEWYGAFGLLVTLVWLYIEILRLIRKLASR